MYIHKIGWFQIGTYLVRSLTEAIFLAEEEGYTCADIMNCAGKMPSFLPETLWGLMDDVEKNEVLSHEGVVDPSWLQMEYIRARMRELDVTKFNLKEVCELIRDSQKKTFYNSIKK